MADQTADSVPPGKCRYMHAAYPDLDADDTCTEHRHDAPTFALARAMAEVWQQQAPTEEQIGWCMNDAAAVVDDFDPAPLSWTVSETRLTREAGLDFTVDINGVEYVIQTNDSGGHVETHPVSRSEWESWMDEFEDDWDDCEPIECDHDWLDRPESDTHVCQACGEENGGPPPSTTPAPTGPEEGER